MNPTIRIDDDVFAYLQNNAQPLVDNPNSVLRRLFALDSTPATRSPARSSLGSQDAIGVAAHSSDDGVLYLEGPGCSARARDSDDAFFVLAGSTARKSAVRSTPKAATEKRRQLLDHGILVEDGASYRFTRDYSFDTPSGAACVIQGGSEDGLRKWKDAEGRSLKELRAR